MPDLVDLLDDGVLDMRWLMAEVADGDSTGEVE
jgi:hypothetical protein